MIKQMLKKFRGIAAFYIGNGVAGVVVSALAVVCFQRLLDGIAKFSGLNPLLPLVAGYGLFAAMEHILYYVDEYPHNRLLHGLEQHLRTEALKKVARMDYRAWQDTGTGRLIQLVENGSRAGANMAFGFWLRIARDLLPNVVINLLFIGAYNAYVMLAVMGGYAVVFLVTALLLKHLYRIKNRILANEEWMSRGFVRALMEIVVFRVNRRFKKEIEEYSKVSDDTVLARTRIRMVHELFFALFALLVLAVKVAIVVVGITQAGAGLVTVGAIVALVAFVDKVYTPIAIFNVLFVDYKLDRVAFDRFQAFMGLPDDGNLEHGGEADVTRGTISLKNLSFTYGGAAVLDHLDADFAGGSVTAVVGASGAGKSTLVKLMLGLLKPDGGSILIDGQDLSGLNLESYYRHIAYISQDAPIFDGTLRENIAFNADVDDAALYDALEKARLAAFVRGLPKGLDTEVGERGVKLSGGERQRLAFARVLVSRPAVVILDEPTSAMDGVTERQVASEFYEALRGSTVVVIAHRLNTVRNADTIMVLQDGAVAERGTHDTLMQLGGVYAGLTRAQTDCDIL